MGHNDVHGLLSRRVSRTDLDFEQALRAEGTVVLKESLDVDALGVLDTSNASFASLSPFSSPDPPANVQPATPTVVPPTPSPSSRPAAATSPAAAPAALPSRGSTSSSSGRDIFYDAQEDTDLQTKRRSMYRSPGTASSPDLATLLRKSRSKDAGASRGGSGASTPLTPNRLAPSPSGRDRQRSATSGTAASSSSASASPHGTPGAKGKLKAQTASLLGIGGAASPDWVLTSPRSMASMRDGGISKVASCPSEQGRVLTSMCPQPAKSSVRAKTSAFLGKMLGTSSTRERSVSGPHACHWTLLSTVSREPSPLRPVRRTLHLPYSTHSLQQYPRSLLFQSLSKVSTPTSLPVRPHPSTYTSPCRT